MRSHLKSGVILTFLASSLVATSAAQAFDLEDYATTYRATRDAYLKAVNELKLAVTPFMEARRPLLALGFDLYQSEQYFFPLDRWVDSFPHFGDLTGQPCLDAGGNPMDQWCNPDATCDAGTGVCGASTGPFANVDLKTMHGLWATAIRYVDTVGTPEPMTIDDYDPWLGYEQFNLSGADPMGSAQLAVGSAWWQSQEYDMQEFFLYMRERRDRFRMVMNDKMTAAGVDVVPGDDGYYHPSLPSATCVLDPVLDHLIIDEMATQYRATRDAMLKAINEVNFARGPYDAARDAYQVATQVYTDGIGCVDALAELEPEPMWVCGARPFPSPVRCACSSGSNDSCTSSEAVVVNEAIPAVSYQMCRTSPTPGEKCLCVHDEAGSPCTAASAIRTYSYD